MKQRCAYLVVGALLLLALAIPAQANVYATNIKFNGSTNNAVLLPGRCLTISYILNENATHGVVAQVLSGSAIVRTVSIPSGNPGTLKGTNAFTWDGIDNLGESVPEGLYSITITASAIGYDQWTQISDDKNPGNGIYDPYGIAVNRNTNSPFYGRIFVGNSMAGGVSGQANGIYKFNADASGADEGNYSNGGYPWTGYMTSPWKLEVSGDDRLYVNDWNDHGVVLVFDQAVSGYTQVFGRFNWPLHQSGSFADLSGPFITGIGTNTQIWMADVDVDSFGILRWSVTPDGVVQSNDFGTLIIAVGATSDLNMAPWDVAIDKNGAIYTIQRILDGADPSCRVLRFPADLETNRPQLLSDWEVGGALATNRITGADASVLPTSGFDNAYGIAVSPDANWVAVAVRGVDRQDGALAILDATTGLLVTNVDSGTATSYIDVAWDNVGNVYGTQEELWRVFSPPGPNQSTTPAVPIIQVMREVSQPSLSAPMATVGQMQFELHGQNNVSYLIQSSLDLTNWTTVVTNYSPTAVRSIQLTPTEDSNFYRAVIPAP